MPVSSNGIMDGASKEVLNGGRLEQGRYKCSKRGKLICKGSAGALRIARDMSSLY